MSFEKVQLSIFETLAFLLPGAITITALWLVADTNVSSFSDMLVMLNQATLNIAVVFGLFAYVVGFIINNFGYELHQRLGLKFWKIDNKIVAEGQVNSAKNVLIREFSPNNFVYLEKWLSYRAFSHNLAFSFLILSISGIVKYFIMHTSDPLWILLGSITLVSIFPLLYRASLYQKLYYLDLNNTVQELDLENRSKKKSSKDK